MSDIRKADRRVSDDLTGPTSESWVFELPSLGADMDSGIVLKWYVDLGDQVNRGDLVARVETEKADIDVEIWQDGVVSEYLADVGDELPVGSPLIRIAGASPTVETPAPAPAPEPPAVPAPRSAPAPPSAPTQTSTSSIRVSPLARKAASERNINLEAVAGSGPDGAILLRDLDAAPGALQQAPVPDPQTKQTAADRMRQAISERMTTANQEIPHYHLQRVVDLGTMIDWLSDHNEDLSPPERVLPIALFTKAVAAAAAARPELNGFWIGHRFEPGNGVHVAMAISLRGGGLVTPVISEADQLSISDTMARLRDLVTGARNGSLRSSWMTGGTITVTNLGENGADSVNGVIFPPQVALVGFGRVREEPRAVDGSVVARPVVTVTLAADHRATDGASGSRFLSVLSDRLQHPEEL